MNKRIAQNVAELSPDALSVGIDVGKKRHQEVSTMRDKFRGGTAKNHKDKAEC